MMFKTTVKCPYCFETIDIRRIGFRCDEPGCDGIVFFRNGKDIPFFERIGLKAPPIRCNHSCGKSTSIRVCPACKHQFEDHIDDLSDLTIAIVGAKESGKSHFIALLIQRIIEMHEEFGWNIRPLDEATIDRYEREFHNPLFHDQQTINTTTSARGGATPLVYSLRLGKSLFPKRIMLVFFDAAGEDLENASNLKYIDRYIYNSSGIICLLDPLQLQTVRENLLANRHNENELPQRNAATGTIIGRIARLIHVNKNLRNRRIGIPLAIAFSKMDFVRDAGESARNVYDALYQESRHKGAFCQAEFDNIDGLMRSWVSEIDDSAEIIQDCSEFKKTGFFGFSALGSNPTNQTLQRKPQPFRVEDPFLWILKLNGLVRTTKG